jgi:hypothetical protein
MPLQQLFDCMVASGWMVGKELEKAAWVSVNMPVRKL